MKCFPIIVFDRPEKLKSKVKLVLVEVGIQNGEDLLSVCSSFSVWLDLLFVKVPLYLPSFPTESFNGHVTSKVADSIFSTLPQNAAVYIKSFPLA